MPPRVRDERDADIGGAASAIESLFGPTSTPEGTVKRKPRTRQPGDGQQVTRAPDGSTGSSSDDDDEYAKYLMEALDLTKKQYRENKASIDAMLARGYSKLESAGLEADQGNLGIVLDMIKKEAALEGVTPAKFIGGYKSKAGKAEADPEAIQAQKDALAMFRERTDPGLTDKERAIIEINRRGQEQNLRASREAALAGQRARGFGGSSQALQATLGAQQEGAQRRMLEDLGASGMAIDRSQAALRDYAGLGGDIRGASFEEEYLTGSAVDDATRFGKILRQDFDQFDAKFRQDERDKKWGRQTDLAGQKYGLVADRYAHQTAPTFFEERATGQRTGAGSQGVQQVSSVLGQLAGATQADRAADILGQEGPGYEEEDEKLNLLDPRTW